MLPGHFNKNKVLSDTDGRVTGLIHGHFPQVHQQSVSVLTQRPHLHRSETNHTAEFHLSLFTPAFGLYKPTHTHSEDNSYYCCYL